MNTSLYIYAVFIVTSVAFMLLFEALKKNEFSYLDIFSHVKIEPGVMVPVGLAN